jgi:hypothetical protein
MSSGLAPSLMIDLAASTITDRQRSSRDREQRALARLARPSVFRRTR